MMATLHSLPTPRHAHPAERRPRSWRIKRVFDRVAAAAGLLVGAPVLAGIAAAYLAARPEDIR